MYTIYTIIQDGVVQYVEKTKDYTHRKWLHLNRIGTHMSAIPTDIDISTIEIHPIALYTDEVQALKFEDWMIRKYDTINNGWNKLRSGHVYVEDMKAWNKAYEQTPKRKAYKQTPEHKEYMHKYYLRKKKEIAAV